MREKLPSFETLLKDRKARDKLTDLQLYNFVQEVKRMAAGLGRPDRAGDSPADFAVRLSGGEWKQADHLRLLSTHLSSLYDRRTRFLAVSMPPRHGKSLLIDVYFPLWWLTKNPKARIILAGYGETFARIWGAMVRDKLIEHFEDTNVLISKTQTAADDWQTTLGGGMVSVGVGGSLVGRGADLLIIDDPIKNDQEAYSPVYRERMWNWWQSSAFTRLQPGGVVVIVCTRWHEDDLLGRIEKENDGRWTFLNIPALAEANDPLGRSLGAPLWPEQWPDDPDYRLRQEGMSPYWWAAQFQGRPVPEGGGVIPRDSFRFYSPSEFPAEPDQWIQSWDPALHDRQTSDYWVGTVWARKGADLFLKDLSRGHYNLQQAISVIRQWTAKYPKALAKVVEATAMGPAIKQTLTHEVPGIIPWPPKGRTLGSKRSRVEAIVPALLAGNIYLPQRKDGTKDRWVWEFVEECAAFDKGTHDDQVDSFTQAVAFMLPGSYRATARAEAERNAPPPPTPAQQQSTNFNSFVKRTIDRANRRLFGHPRRRILS